MGTMLLVVFTILQALVVRSEKSYIVLLKHDTITESEENQIDTHKALLESVLAGSRKGHGHSYTNIINGFSAVMSEEQATTMRKMDNVLSVLEDQLYQLHTTRTPDFLGVNRLLHRAPPELNHKTQDVIIGMFDSGIDPSSASFKDDGMKSIPKRWKGKCEQGVMCNKKLIGARDCTMTYRQHNGGNASAVDEDGHGTHTASTAAGQAVANARLNGFASGTAQGMAPYARLAIYKACGEKGCYGTDILKAFDNAISDGVDVISISIGGIDSRITKDPIAIGSFYAVKRGILVVASAGNDGSRVASVANTSPWIITVAASTLDRDFPATVQFSNDKSINGLGLCKGETHLNLFYGNGNASFCLEGSLNKAQVQGKAVLCDRGNSPRVVKGLEVKRAGGIAMILANLADSGEELMADMHVVKAVAVGYAEGESLRKYARAPNPSVSINCNGTVLSVHPAPKVAAFSSRGPDAVHRLVLKPDITAPGVNILAAWPKNIPSTELPQDMRRTEFNIVSGTSMSCPHISGLSALLKAANPQWSPAAIRSALMTTADTTDNTGKPILDTATSKPADPYAFGAGHVNINRALNPGLVYDISLSDYMTYLCGSDYTESEIKALNISCNQAKNPSPFALNYPSFSVPFSRKTLNVTHIRRLRNVDKHPATYRAYVKMPNTVKATVVPETLEFTKLGSEMEFSVMFEANTKKIDNAFGSILWTDGKHQVKSPVAISWS